MDAQVGDTLEAEGSRTEAETGLQNDAFSIGNDESTQIHQCGSTVTQYPERKTQKDSEKNNSGEKKFLHVFSV